MRFLFPFFILVILCGCSYPDPFSILTDEENEDVIVIDRVEIKLIKEKQE